MFSLEVVWVDIFMLEILMHSRNIQAPSCLLLIV